MTYRCPPCPGSRLNPGGMNRLVWSAPLWVYFLLSCIESETRCAREKSCREPSPERIVLTIEKFKISKSFRSIPTTGWGRPIPATRAILQVHFMFVLLSFDCVPAPSGSLVRSIVRIYLKMANLGGDRQPGCCAPRLDLSLKPANGSGPALLRIGESPRLRQG